MPDNLMNVVKGTDPSTVTQHGLYMRPLTESSLHPLVAKPSPKDQIPSSGDAIRPVTPAQETEQTLLAKIDISPANSDLSPAKTDLLPAKSNVSAVKGETNSDKGAPVAEATTGVTAVQVPENKPADSPVSPDKIAAAVLPRVSGLLDNSSSPLQGSISKKGSSADGLASKGRLPSAEQANTAPEQGTTAKSGKLEARPEVQWGKSRVSLLGDATLATTCMLLSLSCYSVCCCQNRVFSCHCLTTYFDVNAGVCAVWQTLPFPGPIV